VSTASPGDTVNVTFTVANNGQQPIDDVQVASPLAGLSAITCSPTTVAAGHSATCTATYVVTADDATAGTVDVTGSASVLPHGDSNEADRVTTDPVSATVEVDAPPSVVPDAVMVSPTAPTTFNPLVNDSGQDGATLDPTTVVLLGDHGQPLTTLTVPGEGTYTVNNDGTVTFTPVPGFTGTATPISYQVSDSNGLSGTATITVTTFPPPTVIDLTATTGPGSAVTIDPIANDSGNGGATLDPTSVRLLDGNGDPVTSLTTVDGDYTVDPATGVITFTPADGYLGTTPPVTYEVTDSNGTTGAATTSVTVAPVVGAPLAHLAAGGAAGMALVGFVGFGLVWRRRRTG
jgi:CshA-type fibril repeat protein